MNWIDEIVNGTEWVGSLDECLRDNLTWYKEKGSDHGDLVIAEEVIKSKVIFLVQEAHTQGTQEALAKVEEWVKEKKHTKVFKLIDQYEPLSVEKITIPDGLESAFYLGEHVTLDDLLHHLQQLKDNLK